MEQVDFLFLKKLLVRVKTENGLLLSSLLDSRAGRD